MDRITCLLPGGYVDQAGVVHRDVELAPLSGREEALLAESNGRARPCLATAILSRCVRRIGTVSPVSEEAVRSLLVADRQVLLLRLREATFGDQVQATILCPKPDCGARMDVDFSTRDIPVKESEDSGPIYYMELSPDAAFVSEHGQEYRHIGFRLPNGADQEALAPVLARSEAQAAAMLLTRCVQSIGPLGSPTDEQIRGLSPLARAEIEQQMARVAPEVELTLEGDCPECGRAFSLPFDLEGFVLGELNTSLDLLYREVHYLAYHYHWSEREIMDMPRAKRRRYIEVLADEIERLSDAI